MPPTTAALQRGGPVYTAIEHQPTTLITSSYFNGARFMGLAAQLHYQVPFTNVYGFPYTAAFNSSTGKSISLTTSIFSDSYKNLDVVQSKAALIKFVAVRHPKYILSLKPYTSALPAHLLQALDQLYGPPTVTTEAKLWKTK